MLGALALKRGNSIPLVSVLLWCAACAGLLLVATGASYLHQGAPGTFCSICYVAHLPALNIVPVRIPVASFTVVRLVLVELLQNHSAPDVTNSSPRAPPV